VSESTTDLPAAIAGLDDVRLGTAPDSWGVWFPDDPTQVPWDRFLDEAAAAGYEWIELGPYGYLPTDAAQLADELGERGLKLSGGAVFAGLHRGPDALEEAFRECGQEAELLTALGARHLILLPEGFTDLDGKLTQPAELTPEQWSTMTTQMDRLARFLKDDFDVDLVFHPHADSHVGRQADIERFLLDTDPEVTNLCLDTGHVSYYGGDNIALIEQFPERIGYLHLKQVDPEIVREAHEQDLGFAPAVRRGVMVEPPLGVPDMPSLLQAVSRLDVPLFAIVEQDLYPCEVDAPFPIAQRTARYLGACGLGPVRTPAHTP
jgi:inosose dehydratase